MVKKLKILITGSNGYIGKALTNHLSKHDLTRLHRGVCDLTDEWQVDRFFDEKYDLVIHCAAMGGSRLKSDSPDALIANLKMFLNLYKHKDKIGKFIHFGSGAQHHSLETYYGLSKRVISDLMISDRDRFYNFIIYCLFDKNEIDTRFIKSCINKCKAEKPIIVYKNKQMDFFHMEDLMILIDECINNTLKDRELECVYWEIFDLCKIARLVISEMGTGELILGEPGLDKPYTRVGKKYRTGNLEDKIKQTIGELK